MNYNNKQLYFIDFLQEREVFSRLPLFFRLCQLYTEGKKSHLGRLTLEH